MSWRIVSEPWEYGYAQHLHEEMPFKDQEQSMIEEVMLLVVNCTLDQLYQNTHFVYFAFFLRPTT